MREDVEIICVDHADARRAREEIKWKIVMGRLMDAELRRNEKRIEKRKQYRWELALIRIGRFLLVVMSAGMAWMGQNELAAGGVLLSAFFYLVELDRQGKLERMRGDLDAE